MLSCSRVSTTSCLSYLARLARLSRCWIRYVLIRHLFVQPLFVVMWEVFRCKILPMELAYISPPSRMLSQNRPRKSCRTVFRTRHMRWRCISAQGCLSIGEWARLVECQLREGYVKHTLYFSVLPPHWVDKAQCVWGQLAFWYGQLELTFEGVGPLGSASKAWDSKLGDRKYPVI